MKRNLLLFTLACLILTSCHTSKQYAANHTARQPRFIDDIYMASHNKTAVTANVVNHKKTEKKVSPARAAQSDDIASASAHREELPREYYLPVRKNAASKSVAAEINDAYTENEGSLNRKYADMLGVSPQKLSNAALYQFIEKWYGANYRLGGSDESGIDCSGFAQKLYGEVYGIDLERTAKEQFSTCKRIRKSHDAVEGDLVFFHVRSKRISHVGVYLANDYFVHASSSQGVVISNLNSEYWHKYYAGCGRIHKG